MRKVLFAAGLLTSVFVSFTAIAGKTNFKTDLDPGQENQAPDITGHDPTGSARFTYDDQTKFLCGEIIYDDLTGPATGVHIHLAPAASPTADSTVKLLMPPTPSPVKFKLKLNTEFENGLMGPRVLYANVHTAKNANGELRSFTPWLDGDTEVTCPATETNPDGGTTPPGAVPDAGPIPTTTSLPTTTPTTTSPPSTTGGSNDSPSGGDAPLAADTPAVEPAKKGCSAAGSPVSAMSLTVLAGLGMLVVRGRRRRKSAQK